jgi:hypothetical protein
MQLLHVEWNNWIYQILQAGHAPWPSLHYSTNCYFNRHVLECPLKGSSHVPVGKEYTEFREYWLTIRPLALCMGAVEGF